MNSFTGTESVSVFKVCLFVLFFLVLWNLLSKERSGREITFLNEQVNKTIHNKHSS